MNLKHIKESEIKKLLQFCRSVGKRLDEHRELVESIRDNTTLFKTHFWHIGHMAVQDDYLMRLFNICYGHFPNESIYPSPDPRTGEFVRPRPKILGECRLPKYLNQNQGTNS